MSPGFLDGKGRCCGRKPIQYKLPKPHQFCPRCDRDYDEDGIQLENWAWRLVDGEFKAKYPASAAKDADIARLLEVVSLLVEELDDPTRNNLTKHSAVWLSEPLRTKARAALAEMGKK
jgi:hypothetical protein